MNRNFKGGEEESPGWHSGCKDGPGPPKDAPVRKGHKLLQGGGEERGRQQPEVRHGRVADEAETVRKVGAYDRGSSGDGGATGMTFYMNSLHFSNQRAMALYTCVDKDYEK